MTRTRTGRLFGAVECVFGARRPMGGDRRGGVGGMDAEWCAWGSWDGPERGRVQICHKGAPRRNRWREEARNINDSLPALRVDRGLCGRFGQTSPRAPRGAHGPGGGRGGRPDRPGGPTGAPLSNVQHSRKRPEKGRGCAAPEPGRLFRGGFEDVGREDRGGGLLGSPPGASVGSGAAGSAGRVPGAARAASGAVPAPRPRFASITHLAWWDDVSHVVTRPGRRDAHSAPGNDGRTTVVQRNASGPHRRAPP